MLFTVLKNKSLYHTPLACPLLKLYRRLLDNATDYETGVHAATGHVLPRFLSMFVCSGHIRDFVKGEEMMLWEVSEIGSEVIGPFLMEFVIFGMHHRFTHPRVLFFFISTFS